MCIQTADVNKLICLIFNEIHNIIEYDNYGIDCKNIETDLEKAIKLLNYYNFECFSTDYIKTYVIDGVIPTTCNRYEFSNTIPR